jgi:hypothetical protein
MNTNRCAAVRSSTRSRSVSLVFPATLDASACASIFCTETRLGKAWVTDRVDNGFGAGIFEE